LRVGVGNWDVSGSLFQSLGLGLEAQSLRQGACNSGKPGIPGKLREFLNYGKLREFQIYSGNFCKCDCGH